MTTWDRSTVQDKIPDAVNTLVYDRNNWMWQRRTDKWVCVTQGIDGPPTRMLNELIDGYGPIHLLVAPSDSSSSRLVVQTRKGAETR